MGVQLAMLAALMDAGSQTSQVWLIPCAQPVLPGPTGGCPINERVHAYLVEDVSHTHRLLVTLVCQKYTSSSFLSSLCHCRLPHTWCPAFDDGRSAPPFHPLPYMWCASHPLPHLPCPALHVATPPHPLPHLPSCPAARGCVWCHPVQRHCSPQRWQPGPGGGVSSVQVQ
jgi:hypothetical protein